MEIPDKRKVIAAFFMEMMLTSLEMMQETEFITDEEGIEVMENVRAHLNMCALEEQARWN